MTRYLIGSAAVATAVLLWFAVFETAHADHAWGNFHWARTANPFTLKLGDNVSSQWDAYLITSASDWSVSSILDTTIVGGGTLSNVRLCRPTKGRVEVCNTKYGNNGWLGIASVWALGDHITQGTVKMNDTYYNTSKYNTPAWRNLVMCQEIGHTLGLDHQDEIFTNANLDTCMDYSNNPLSNQHPNAHDYEMLETIYAHLDTTTTLAQSSQTSAPTDIDTSNPREWGREIRSSERASLYMRDFGNGNKVFTHVFWAEPEVGRARGEHEHDH